MQREMCNRLALAALTSIGLLGNRAADAAITFYSTPAEFNASFTDIQTTNFSSLTPVPFTGYTEFPGAQVTVGSDTFRASSSLFALFGCCGHGSYGVTFLSAQTVGPGPSSLRIATPGVTAIAFDYGNYFFPPEPITVTLNTGDQFTIPDADDNSEFIGFSSTVTFYTITLSTMAVSFPQGTTLDLLDVEQVPAAPTPEPGTWALILLGVCLLGLSLRRTAGQPAA
jgi:hypothetical protein